jgi:uncharacterized protein YjiS (DUF1127 family)
MLISSAASFHPDVPQPLGAKLVRPFASLIAAARAALQHRRTRIALEDLDQHLLNDVGLGRFQPTPDPFAIAIDCSSWR